VSLYNARVQDDSDVSVVILWNTFTGRYILCCGGTSFTGVGKVSKQGAGFQLEHNAVDRRLVASLSGASATARGTASMQLTGGRTCTLADKDVRNDSSVCGNNGLDCKASGSK
jgi:hypothetical protein